MNSYNMEELKSWIGREVTYTAPEELGAASIRYFALALGDENPLFRDEAYAETYSARLDDRAADAGLRDQSVLSEPA